MVVEHDVISVGDSHEIVASGHGQQCCQIFNVVLVSLHVVGVATVATHGNAGEFAHEMVLQTGAGYLPGIVQILRANETHHGVHKEGLESFGKAVATGLHGDLVSVMVSVAA